MPLPFCPAVVKPFHGRASLILGYGGLLPGVVRGLLPNITKGGGIEIFARGGTCGGKRLCIDHRATR